MIIKIINKVITKLFIFIIKQYQFWLRHWLGLNCRFTPTCSDYAIECIKLHGVLKGGYFIAHRLCRCQPFVQGGIDEVPKRKK